MPRNFQRRVRSREERNLDISFKAGIGEFDVVERDGVGLILRVVLRSTNAAPQTSLTDGSGAFEWPAAIEISFRMQEGEIAERLWALRGRSGLDVKLRIEAADGTL